MAKASVLALKLKARVNRLFTKPNLNTLIEFIRAVFKTTDHNSILGVFWSLINPIAMLAVLYFIFRARFGQGVNAYPLYLLIGISSVNFFIIATTYLIDIFFTYKQLILNSTMPREYIIISELYLYIYKYIIEIIVCMALSIYYGLLKWKFLALIFPLLFAYIALALGVGLMLSLIYCLARDIKHIWIIISRLFLFATPVFYTMDKISSDARLLVYWCNPLTPFLISLREIIMGSGHPGMFTYMHSLLLGSCFFIFGYCIFILFENMAVERA